MSDSRSLTDKIKQEITILDYAKQIGLTPVKVGSQYSIKEMDSVRIKENKSVQLFYRHSSRHKGSVIDFAMMAHDQSLQQAIKQLAEMIGYHDVQPAQPTQTVKLPKKPPAPRKPFALPEKSYGSYRHAFAYLTKARGIDTDTVSDLLGRNYLYEDVRYNAVFVGVDPADGKPACAFKRSTNTLTEQSYRGLTAGSRNVGWTVDNGSRSLIVCEAAIDCMSVMTLCRHHGKDPMAYNYHALLGCFTASLHHLMQHQQFSRVYIATDNDEAGAKARENIKKELTQNGFAGKIIDMIPIVKDFNEDLQHSQGAVKAPQSVRTQKAPDATTKAPTVATAVSASPAPAEPLHYTR